MKKLILSFIISFSVVIASFSQTTFKNEPVEASAVPAGVTSSFNAKYSGINVIRWEKHIFTNKNGKTFVKYVSVFDKDEIRHRSRYKEEGTALSATAYYWFKNKDKLPVPIKKYTMDKYPDFTLTGGEKELSHKSGKYVYRVRLKKGASKLVIYMNEKGEEVSKDNIDQEILDNEKESGK